MALENRNLIGAALLSAGLAGGLGYEAGESVGKGEKIEELNRAEQHVYKLEKSLRPTQLKYDAAIADNSLLSEAMRLYGILGVKLADQETENLDEIVDKLVETCEDFELEFIELSEKVDKIEKREIELRLFDRLKEEREAGGNQLLEEWKKDPEGSYFWLERQAKIANMLVGVARVAYKFASDPRFDKATRDRLRKLVKINEDVLILKASFWKGK